MPANQQAGDVESLELVEKNHAVDRHVGLSIRTRRRLLGISQQELGDSLGLTFQQVQKYERGANRVSASKLHAIAEVLQVPISYFFEGLPEAGDEVAARQERSLVRDMLATNDGREMATLWQNSTLKERRAVLAVLRLIKRDDA